MERGEKQESKEEEEEEVKTKKKKKKQATCVTQLTLMFMLPVINHAVQVWSSWQTIAFFSTNIVNHNLKYGSQGYSACRFKIQYFWRIKKTLMLLFKHD
jgi:hypothetical protein